MAEPGEGRLGLTILGGFLGAGKSTWARHQLHEGQFARHHLIVNEAAGTPVDNLLLGGAARLSVLAGGCACCEGLPALISLLRHVCDENTGAAGRQIDGILLETSGLADPGAIARAIAADPVLARHLRITTTLVLIDALHGLAQLSAEPLARAQAEAADRLILTKAMRAEPGAAGDLLATLRLLNPAADISGAELGLAVALPEPGTARLLAGPERQAPIRPWRLDVGAEGAWVALSTWLSALLAARGEDVVRVKGVVRTPAGRLLLQSVRRVVQPPEILPETELAGPAPEEGVIVLIGRNFDAAMLERSWRLFGPG
ncbi:CobW family GTP-binding protein [Pseudogemmobacter faecipullorum]|uniref:GTP-binding protein n=1 Tax=Pseudogemmobacter faecipullorum TaxID=2755041 RepID=A0ABS8CJW6_9RHOB|nr:GTP-binding protein [Pseudogemmobacter faecipullorum]MCB5409468.1 GTP-binding protein [Pseudogemmobacter faecipullorum]